MFEEGWEVFDEWCCHYQFYVDCASLARLAFSEIRFYDRKEERIMFFFDVEWNCRPRSGTAVKIDKFQLYFLWTLALRWFLCSDFDVVLST